MPIWRCSGASARPGSASTAPCARIVPPSIDSNPAIQRKAVVLPHPLGPSKQPIAPRSSWNESPFTAVRAPNVRTTSTSSSHMLIPARQHRGWNQPDEHDCNGRERRSIPFAFGGHLEDAHSERVPAERPRDERDRHLLHHIDEDENRGRYQAGTKERHMNSPQERPTCNAK